MNHFTYLYTSLLATFAGDTIASITDSAVEEVDVEADHDGNGRSGIGCLIA